MKNEDVIKEWHGFTRWGTEASLADEETTQAIVRYVIYTLSKGFVPSRQIIEPILKGERKVQKCGYINCFGAPDDHVH